MLGPLTRGEERACFGISEPNTGLDTTRVSMRATWDGTNYIATGTKVWPTMASTAARIMLLARTTPIDQCRSEEHTSELQSLMRISYAVFCLKKNTTNYEQQHPYTAVTQ